MRSSSSLPTLVMMALYLMWIPNAFCGADATQSAGVSGENISHSHPNWKRSHTPQRFRLGVSAGDHAGGPVRYNTRFPEIKGDPQPASYYHAQAFGGIEIEYSTRAGGVIAQYMVRRDLWHKKIAARTTSNEVDSWTVKDFKFSDRAMYLGWALGERYLEMPWSLDLGLVYDTAEISGLMSRSGAPEDVDSYRITLDSLSGRVRLHLLTTGSGWMQVGLGPEIHIPLWSRLYDASSERLYGWISDRLELRHAAAIGLGVITNLRF